MLRALKNRLVPNVRRVMKHSWSFHLATLGTVLGAIQTGMMILAENPPINPVAFAVVLTLVTGLGGIARLFRQSSVSGDEA